MNNFHSCFIVLYQNNFYLLVVFYWKFLLHNLRANGRTTWVISFIIVFRSNVQWRKHVIVRMGEYFYAEKSFYFQWILKMESKKLFYNYLIIILVYQYSCVLLWLPAVFIWLDLPLTSCIPFQLFFLLWIHWFVSMLLFNRMLALQLNNFP